MILLVHLQSGKGSRTNPYHLGWTKQKGVASLKNSRYTIKLHNKTNYQLTHLLEDGHATRSGTKRTKAIKHIEPIATKYSEIYKEKIITAIRRRK